MILTSILQWWVARDKREIDDVSDISVAGVNKAIKNIKIK